MYEDCLNCSKMGVSCDGPNFVTMSAPELLAWCKERKSILRLSNARLAEMSGMAKGTIDRLFAGEHVDFRYETIRPLLRALVGGDVSGNPCPTSQEDAAAQAEIERLKKDIIWHEDKIKHILEENARLVADAQAGRERHKEELAFSRKEIKRKNTAIVILSSIAGLAVLYIIVTLIIDRLDPERGLYWLESLIRIPQSMAEHTKIL